MQHWIVMSALKTKQQLPAVYIVIFHSHLIIKNLYL